MLFKFILLCSKKKSFQWIQSGDSIETQSSYKWSVFIRLFRFEQAKARERNKQNIQLQKDIYTEVEKISAPAK